MKGAPKAFTYYGIRVNAMSPNTSGLRYETSVLSDIARLRADTKAGIKAMIRERVLAEKKSRRAEN